MQNKQLPPFNRGDEVIDDNAEIGYVLENYIDATWDAAGNLTNWHTRIHYRWDQPSYGLTRVVSEGEISLLTQREPDKGDSPDLQALSTLGAGSALGDLS